MEKGTKTILWVIVVIIVLLIVWAIYAYLAPTGELTVDEPVSTEPIKIGWIGALTGDLADAGQNARVGSEIAVEEINAAGGINGRPLELIFEDGKCSGKDASNAANKLMNIDKVPAIVGGLCSSETSAFVEAAKEIPVVVMSYCSSAPSLSQAGDHFFRVYPPDTFQGKYAARYAYNDLGVRKVAILYLQDDWGNGLKDRFEENFIKLGGEITIAESVKSDDKDVKTQLTKIKETDSDLIYMPLIPGVTEIAIKAARELGIEAKFLGGDAWDVPSVWESLDEAGEGVQFLVPYSPMSDEFRAKMKEKTGSEDIIICAPGAYDAVKIFAKIISEVGTDPVDIMEALSEMEPYTESVVAESVSFDENGDIETANYAVKIVSDGVAEESTIITE